MDPREDDLEKFANFRMALDQLVRSGWIVRYDLSKREPIVEWTAHGTHCARFLRRIETELNGPNSEAWLYIMAACRFVAPNADKADQELN